MNKKSRLIKDTTREEREKRVKDAFAIVSLGSPEPPEADLVFFEDYIEGRKELDQILQEVIAKYTKQR